jgi:hypothetical protein
MEKIGVGQHNRLWILDMHFKLVEELKEMHVL